MYEEKFMRRAIEISAAALERQGVEPFGAVIVRDGQIVGEGMNKSRLNFDPTSHGETEAIRDACQRLQTVDLRGCELYTSCEPCALCVAAMEIAGISKLYYAAGLHQANKELESLPQETRPPVDTKRLQEECGKSVGERAIPAKQLLAEEAMNVIRSWATKSA